MKVDVDRFQVRLAESDEDIAAAQRLRYKVFVEEMGAQASPEEHAARLERDEFDPYFEHLLLIDKQAIGDPLDKVCGVYRLMRGSAARAGIGFYGASEYDLEKLGDLMNINQGLLNALQVSCWEIEELAEIARKNGALGAKLTGGGGGGALIALCPENSEQVVDEMKKCGYKAIVTQIG